MLTVNESFKLRYFLKVQEHGFKDKILSPKIVNHTFFFFFAFIFYFIFQIDLASQSWQAFVR